jgi:hypothetical protein
MDPEAPRHVSWYHTPVGIALLAFFVLGPLVLPLVWRSPALGPRGRWIATALIAVYTIALGWLVWIDVRFVLSQIQP